MAANPVHGDTTAGSAGTDVSLPATDSQVSVSGHGAFSNLKVTVNQTQHLLNQAISIDWAGAPPTHQNGGRAFFENYLQFMQCWGDDDGTNPDNPGPPPEKCEGGASTAQYGGVPGGNFPASSNATTRLISRKGWDNYDPSAGFAASNGDVYRSFQAVDGTRVDDPYNHNFNPAVQGGVFWQNPYFNIVTTNELAAVSRSDGKGTATFEVDTGIESTGLGCGQTVEPVTGGGKRIPKCWLVIVPRGTAADENAGTPAGAETGVFTSPLAPAAWANRIAIPLGFNPVDASCPLSATLRQIIGSQLTAPAATSWQPKLCENRSLEPYVYGTISDAAAKQQIAHPQPGGPGMAVVSSPLAATDRDPADPAVYAPLTLSGTVVAFNIERNVKPDAPTDEQALAGAPVEHLNLTPRLIAKLLTQSYLEQVQIGDVKAPYDWVKNNPIDMGFDPDFLQFNPEFAHLNMSNFRNFSGLVLPEGSFDAAQQLWAYVLADPEAKAWLDGTPDRWGMKVNPVYATSAGANPSSIAFGDPLPSSFPKSDPYCYQAQPVGGAGLVPPALCGTDWMPYAGSFRDAAHITRLADDGAKVVENVFAGTKDGIWGRGIPQLIGSRSMIGISDSASAFQYGVQTASLSRAGDDGDGRAFVAADVSGFIAAVNAMKPTDEPAVIEPDPKASNSSAYPLTVLTYGVIEPLSLDSTARAQYAAFVDYAAGDGQVPGQLIGQLPPGYAALPAPLRTQAKDAAQAIRTMKAPAGASDVSVSPPDVSSSAAPSSSTPDVGEPTGSAAVGTPSAETPPLIAGPPLATGAGPTTGSASAQAKAVARGLTPVVATAATRFTLPVLFFLALAAALAVLEITKRPRRPAGDVADRSDGPRIPGAPAGEASS